MGNEKLGYIYIWEIKRLDIREIMSLNILEAKGLGRLEMRCLDILGARIPSLGLRWPEGRLFQ